MEKKRERKPIPTEQNRIACAKWRDRHKAVANAHSKKYRERVKAGLVVPVKRSK